MRYRTSLAKTLSVALLTVHLTACMTSPTLSPEQRPAQWGQLISAPNNFYQMAPDLFRSEQPSAELLPLLKQHEIDVVINLRSSNKDPAVFKQQSDIRLVHIPIQTWAISREDLLVVMQEIQRAKTDHKKVLIHCYHGSDRTGASLAMYRIIFEQWSIEQAVQEMKHGGYGFHVIWHNINALFSPENIKWIQQQLSNPSPSVHKS